MWAAAARVWGRMPTQADAPRATVVTGPVVPPDVLAPMLVHELLPLLVLQGSVLADLVQRSGGQAREGEAARLRLAAELSADLRRTVELLAATGRPASGTTVAQVMTGVLRRHPGARVSVRGAVGTALVDGARLAVVLDNLVRNEVEHGRCPAPGVVAERWGDRVRVDVQHDGGPPAGLLAALTGPGAAGGVAPAPQARGLGLLLVRRLVEQMDGTVELRRLGRSRWSVRVDVATDLAVERAA